MRLRNIGTVFAILAFIFCFAAGVANGEVYIKQIRHTDAYSVMGQSQPEKDEVVVTWLGKERARIDTGEESTVIVLSGKKIMYMINHKEKTYAELPTDAKDMMGAMMQGRGGQTEEAKKGMEMAMKMAPGFLSNIEATVTETGETKKIKDWDCRKYLIEIGMPMGKTKAEAWATEDVKLDPGLYWMAASAMMLSQPGFDKVIQEMQKIKGMVVYQENITEAMGSQIRMVEEVVEISDKAAPAGTFDIPAGYKKTEGMGR